MVHNWDDYAAEWEKDPATAQFSDLVFAELQALHSLKGANVLDFGCGTGLLSQRVAPFARSVVALDASEAMIEELDKKTLANVEPVVDELTRGLVAQHPAFRKQFDLVIASSVCGFIPDFKEAATIIYSLLDEQGIFVHWDWLSEDESEGLTQESAHSILHQAGFSDIEISIPFEIEMKDGTTMPVLMGVAYK
ncbi:SAM-dependent methyltransferase [Vibrio breoganii]|uniref:SAM-dependent methyltransferase n=1 Tax=Vibrio breoganii TaxID=553239 RepID=A0AAP8MVD8_9VIBR|nr:class I SAM-dependent methyltransferase [Vibrio breoganii]MDN3715908.1 class I SAM-dependent methyltransferase [Vibrio breoganii]NMO75102.1 class I SAM-dependent methyltransferase [Vibrio breoganii]NMR69423.1 class I SAM-dependent methyltransferase [Vibrio breoganii]OED89058.1 SAM-dependent methyltransferase [Vibrio breoganii ZF-55]PMG02847.1 SAM-dependent methyltransferase [Vibrio breoganii]